jgi:hypothetical protein
MKPEDLEALRALPVRDVDPAVAGRIHRSALAELVREGGVASRLLLRGWSRFLVPAVLAATVGVYLTCAVQAASALYR